MLINEIRESLIECFFCPKNKGRSLFCVWDALKKTASRIFVIWTPNCVKRKRSLFLVGMSIPIDQFFFLNQLFGLVTKKRTIFRVGMFYQSPLTVCNSKQHQLWIMYLYNIWNFFSIKTLVIISNLKPIPALYSLRVSV